MTRQVLHFGECSLDIAARELRCSGERIDLPPTVFDCIAYLVSHRDRAVGRDELVAAVWGRTSVSDTMLGKAILAARRAVGDTAEAQGLLRTVPRFGYHWVGPVREDAPGASDPPPDSAARPPVPTAGRRFAPAIWLVLVLALAGAIAWSVADHGRVGEAPARDAARAPASVPREAPVAVLPAAVLGGAGDEWLRLGLMDLLANRLREGGVRVVPSENVVRVVSGDLTTEQAVAAMHAAIDTRELILPAARHAEGHWRVRADTVSHGGHAAAVEAIDASPVVATEKLANRLLARLGRPSADGTAGRSATTLTELLQRTDAARLAENLDLARAVITQAPAELRNRPEVRERGVRIDLRAGQFDKARREVEALLAEVPAEAEPAMHARLLETLCSALLRLDRLVDAEAACDRAIALLEPRNEPLALGRSYNGRGIIHLRRGEYDAALADFSRSRIALTLAGDPLLLAQLDGNESVLQKMRGRPAEALPTLERSGRTFQRFGMLNEFVTSLVNQIDANLLLLRPLDALQASDAGWAERDRLTDPEVRDAFIVARADALAANGRLDESRGLLDGVMHAADSPAGAAARATARMLEAELDLATGEATAALVLARQALGDLMATDQQALHARTWLAVVRALHALGQEAQAAGEVEAFSAWAAAASSPFAAMDAALARAEHFAATRRSEEAVAAFEEALRHADACGVPLALRDSAVPYADYLLASGQEAAAADVVGKIAGHAGRDYLAARTEARLYRALGQRSAWEQAQARAARLAGQRPVPPQAAPDLRTTAPRNTD